MREDDETDETFEWLVDMYVKLRRELTPPEARREFEEEIRQFAEVEEVCGEWHWSDPRWLTFFDLHS